MIRLVQALSKRTTALAGASAFAVVTAANAQVDPSRFIALSTTLVKVEAVSPDGKFHLGSGVVVAPDRVATNCHVTRFAERINVGRGGLRWRAVAQFADVEKDLCLLATRGMQTDIAKLGKSTDLQVDDAVSALGFEGGLSAQFRQGVVRSLHMYEGANVVQSTTAFTSGASGGGLFDGNGSLVGILTFRLRGAEGNYFALPVDWVTSGLADSSKYLPIAPMGQQKAFWQQTPQELPFFMRANSLEVERKWTDLLGLTQRWGEAQPTNAEPWYVRGHAYLGLAQSNEALDAFQKALAMDPRHAGALYNLGLAQVRAGKLDAARETEAKLRAISATLADKLNKDIAAQARASGVDKS